MKQLNRMEVYHQNFDVIEQTDCEDQIEALLAANQLLLFASNFDSLVKDPTGKLIDYQKQRIHEII